MESTLAPVEHRVPAGGIELSVREWAGSGRPLLLVHGLASNARTWDGVARGLNAAGHHVVAVDQRGHGHSDKPESGYGFDAVTADLRALIGSLALERPIVAGQSWGGNVVLHFDARYPGVASGLVLVDGGFSDLSARAGATWEDVSQRMRPPNLLGTPVVDMEQRLRTYHPKWDDAQIAMQMGNYEALEDGTIRPWLTLDRHMEILRAIWDEPPSPLYGRVTAPVLIAAADSGEPEQRQARRDNATKAAGLLAKAEHRVFKDAPHDIHVDQPDELAGWILEAIERGFFGETD